MQGKTKTGAENDANAGNAQKKIRRARKTVQLQAVCKENKTDTQNDANASENKRGHAKRYKCKWNAKKTKRARKTMQMQEKTKRARKTMQMQCKTDACTQNDANAMQWMLCSASDGISRGPSAISP